jgi:hypothetical protein
MTARAMPEPVPISLVQSLQQNPYRTGHLLETVMNDAHKQQQGQDAGQPAQTSDELIGEFPPDAIQSDANDNSFLADLPEDGQSRTGSKGGKQGS